MKTPTTFAQLPYRRPEILDLREQYHQLYKQLQSASLLIECIAVVQQWNSLRIENETMESLANTRFQQNVQDSSALQEYQFFIEHSPDITQCDESIARALITHPLRAEMETHFGRLFFLRLESSVKTFHPDIKELLVQEATITQEYTALLAEGTIPFRGETYNLSGIKKFAESTDRQTRIESIEAQQEYLQSAADKLDELYSRLVPIRHSIAVKTGFRNYQEYRFAKMYRFDYAPDDIRRFRSVIRDIIVPFAHTLFTQQAKRLGLSGDMYFADESCHFSDGNPHPVANETTIIQDARTMYHELSPETGVFFDMMIERGLLDLSTRPNKARGGFCTSFPLYKVPFIFSNFNGTAGDITVLTHETGHAFQVFCSSQERDLLDEHWPTMEACEIHSFGMELFTWQWMEVFFGKDTDKFRFLHIEQALTFLPYSCAVDEFQEWVYANPYKTAQERNEYWNYLEQRYLPWRRYFQQPFYQSGRYWLTQLHIFLYPFYYIDYALAQICALQLWIRHSNNDVQAFQDYLTICKVGGSLSFMDIIKTAGIQSPFEKQTIHNVLSYCQHWLQSMQDKHPEW